MACSTGTISCHCTLGYVSEGPIQHVASPVLPRCHHIRSAYHRPNIKVNSATSETQSIRRWHLSRREALSAAVGLAAFFVTGAESGAAEAPERRGLSKYIKRKALDPIDSYLPPVLQARKQLVKAGEIMGRDPAAAKTLLREGAFDGLRDNIRAIGEIAAQNNVADATATVNAFFKALESYDFRLFEAVRFGRPVADGTDHLLHQTLQALDRVVETAPLEEQKKAEEVMRVIQQKLDEMDGDDADANPGFTGDLKLLTP